MHMPKKPIAPVRTKEGKTWHIDAGTNPDGSRRRERGGRRIFSADYKLAILAEYDRMSEPGEKGALLRREGYSAA